MRSHKKGEGHWIAIYEVIGLTLCESSTIPFSLGLEERLKKIPWEFITLPPVLAGVESVRLLVPAAKKGPCV